MIEELIAKVNKAGYTVSLHQYRSNENGYRWDAQALFSKTTGGASYMKHISFGQTITEVLQSIVAKIDAETAPVACEFGDLA